MNKKKFFKNNHLIPWLISHRSLRVSPIKLITNTDIKITIPGKIDIHGVN